MKLIRTAIASAVFFASAAGACTWIGVQSADTDSVVVTRTQEFPLNIESQFIVIPRDEAHFGMYGMNAFSEELIIEGANEVGLTASGLWFNTPVAGYSDQGELAPHEVINYVLERATTVEEAAEILTRRGVNNKVHEGSGIFATLHWAFTDARGGSIVVEPVQGEMVIHQNTVSVMTNAPSYDWHMQNLSNYVNMTPNQPTTTSLNGVLIHETGTGGGMLGMPGDFTPASRFVRMAYLLNSNVESETSKDAQIAGWNTISNVNITKGNTVAANSMGPEDDKLNYTQWISTFDTNTGDVTWRTWDNPNIVGVNVHDIGFDNDEIVRFEMQTKKPNHNLAVDAVQL